MSASQWRSGPDGRRKSPFRASLFAVALVAGGLAGGCGKDASPPPPSAAAAVAEAACCADRHLLLITIDTLRSDRLGAYGHAAAATPHLDRLAQEGVRFANAYSSVPLTLPSHASLFTGRYPFATGVRNNGSYVLPASAVTLAELLQQRGFVTSAILSAYVLASKFGLAQGFAAYDDALGSEQLLRSFASDIPADEVARRFRRWLAGSAAADVGKERPFFAWLHFYDPHQPYEPPGDLAQRFAADPYDGEIAHVDRNVGEVLAALDERGLLNDTVIVVTSDHGEGFGEHGEYGHGIFCYEESLRVPLILWARQGLPRQRVIAERVRLIDVLPTLGELFDLAPPADLDGLSLAGFLTADSGDEPTRSVYFESLLGQEDKHWAPLTGLIEGDHKYIALPRRELYDLRADPGEHDDLVGAERGRVRDLDAALRQLLASRAVAVDARRDLDAEDSEHLRALGYLSASRASELLDPKDGIAIENALQAVRGELAAGNVDEAAARLARAAAAHAGVEMPEIYDLRHSLAAARGDSEVAEQVLRSGMERFPDARELPFRLAAYLVERGELDEAEVVSRELLARHPRFAQAWILLARAAEARWDLPAALAAYRQALAIETRSSALRRAYAEALVRAGEQKAALAVYDELVAEGAFDQAAADLYKVAMLHGRFGDPATAEALFRQGLEIAPGGIHHLSFAFLLRARGQSEEALAHLESALTASAEELSAEQRRMAQQALAAWRREG